MLWPSLIAGLSTVISAYVAHMVQKVHVLVNSRLDQALSEINDLKTQRDLKAASDDQSGPATPAPDPIP